MKHRNGKKYPSYTKDLPWNSYMSSSEIQKDITFLPQMVVLKMGLYKYILNDLVK